MSQTVPYGCSTPVLQRVFVCINPLNLIGVSPVRRIPCTPFIKPDLVLSCVNECRKVDTTSSAVHNRGPCCDQPYFINLIRRVLCIRTRKRCAKGSNRGRRERNRSSYPFVFPRFRPRPFVSSCESGIWQGAGMSFSCADILCFSVSHMTSLIPLARASCVFNRATSSSSSVVRPSGRAAGSASFSCSAAGLDLG